MKSKRALTYCSGDVLRRIGLLRHIVSRLGSCERVMTDASDKDNDVLDFVMICSAAMLLTELTPQI